MKGEITSTECELPAGETRGGLGPVLPSLLQPLRGRWCPASSKSLCIDPHDWASIIKRAEGTSFTLSSTMCRFSLLLSLASYTVLVLYCLKYRGAIMFLIWKLTWICFRSDFLFKKVYIQTPYHFQVRPQAALKIKLLVSIWTTKCSSSLSL